MFLTSIIPDHIDSYAPTRGIEGSLVFQPHGNGSFNSLKRVDEIPENQCSALGCIHRAMISAGLTPAFTMRQNVTHGQFGPVHGLMLSAINVTA
jgi:hypothetical protein